MTACIEFKSSDTMQSKYITYSYLKNDIPHVAQIDKITLLYYFLEATNNSFSYLDAWTITRQSRNWKCSFIIGYNKTELDLSKHSLNELDMSKYLKALGGNVNREDVLAKIASKAMQPLPHYVVVSSNFLNHYEQDCSTTLKIISDIIEDSRYRFGHAGTSKSNYRPCSGKNRPLSAGAAQVHDIITEALFSPLTLGKTLGFDEFCKIKQQIIAAIKPKTVKSIGFFNERQTSTIALYNQIITKLDLVADLPKDLLTSINLAS